MTGYAVFGPDYTDQVSGTGVDGTYADLSYVDDLGYTSQWCQLEPARV